MASKATVTIAHGIDGLATEKIARFISLAGESFDVVNDFPTLRLSERSLPRKHRRAALRDFPKQLAIGFASFDPRTQVCRLFLQGGRAWTITSSSLAVANHAV